MIDMINMIDTGENSAAAVAVPNPLWNQRDLSVEAVAEKVAKLARYHKEVERISKTEKPSKPDMQAFRILKDELSPHEIHGHVKGVAVGERFANRGELAILGLHRRILQGIDGGPNTPHGAYAICLSGGYKDDEDDGTTFWYTGQGGNVHGKQAADQQWVLGNQALRSSQENQMPVRVMRGSKEGKQLLYVYEGLYMVKEHKTVPSIQGPLVIKFLMVGMPGESTATMKVQYASMYKRNPNAPWAMHGKRLAAADDDEDDSDSQDVANEGRKRGKSKSSSKSKHAARQAPLKKRGTDLEAERKHRLAEIRCLRGLLLEDISCGLERLPIPLINEINDRGLPEGFCYIKDLQFAPLVEELVAPLLAVEDDQMLRYLGGSCGLDFNRRVMKADSKLEGKISSREVAVNYNSHGRLTYADCMGVHECDSRCQAKSCMGNQQVSNGIMLPLEVYMTAKKGYALKCADLIKGGTFVCSYIGQVITEPQAEALKGQDEYLFSLDHFTQIYEMLAETPDAFKDTPAHYIPPPAKPDMAAQLNSRIALLNAQWLVAGGEDGLQELAAAGLGDVQSLALAGQKELLGDAPAHVLASEASGVSAASTAEGMAVEEEVVGAAPTADVAMEAVGAAPAAVTAEEAGGAPAPGISQGAREAPAACVTDAGTAAAAAGSANVSAQAAEGGAHTTAAAAGPGTNSREVVDLSLAETDTAPMDAEPICALVLRGSVSSPFTQVPAAASSAADDSNAPAGHSVHKEGCAVADQSMPVEADVQVRLVFTSAGSVGEVGKDGKDAKCCPEAGPGGAGAPLDAGDEKVAVSPHAIKAEAPSSAGAAVGVEGGAAASSSRGKQLPSSLLYLADPSSHACELLAVDAARISNVARFINHSCEPNLQIQPVFAKKCRSTVFYYISFFASQDIPANTELSYDYGSKMTHVHKCQCGAPTCVSKRVVG